MKPRVKQNVITPGSPFPTERGDRQWHRVLRVSIVFAAVLHLLLVFFLYRVDLVPESPFAAAGPNRGDSRAAAGGGSGMQAINIRVQPEEPATVIPTPAPVLIPEPVVEAPVIEPEPAPVPAEVTSQTGTGTAGTGGDQGTATGAGTATGTGQGGGGTEETGTSGVVPPRPRGMILPPRDPPRSARGMEITVWVYVDARGRVVENATRLEPPTSDSNYNERLKESAADWVFEPATKEGVAVAAWYPYEIIL